MALFYGRRGCTRTRHKYFPQENLMDTVIVGECGVVAGGAREFGGIIGCQGTLVCGLLALLFVLTK